MSWTTYIVFDAFCIFYRNCKKIWRHLRWIIKNSCKNTSECMRISLPSHSCSYSVFPEIGRKIRGCIRVSCVLLLWPLTCLAWNGPREQSRLGRAHGLKGLLVHLLERWCEATCRVFLTIVFTICRLLTLARPLLIFLFLVSWRSNTAIFRAKRGSARQAHKNERGAGQMKWE